MKGPFKTLKTFKKLEKPELYVMDYVADYNLDKLLAMESGSDEEFAKNVCVDLGLGTEFVVPIAHAIRIQILEHQIDLFLN